VTLSTFGHVLKGAHASLLGVVLGDSVVASGSRQVQSMSEVLATSSSHPTVYFTWQFSASSSPAATHTCPKLSQYVSQRPAYGPVRTRAVQPVQVTASTSGQTSNEEQEPSGSTGVGVGEGMGVGIGVGVGDGVGAGTGGRVAVGSPHSSRPPRMTL